MSPYRHAFSLVRASFATRARLGLVAAGVAAFAQPALAQDGVEEILVTVRQRAESVQDVPGTVSVLSAEAIEAAGVERARDFIALTPGVSIVNAAEVADSQVNIRGINGARDAETNYALIIDGILMTNPAALNREYTNLQQIEVLKGPQGAIYGRNAAAGAFVITTQEPGEEFGGDVKASAAQDDTYLVAASFGGPLTDTLRWSLSGDYRNGDGFYSNVQPVPAFDSEFYPEPGCSDCVDYFDDWSATARLIYEPNENTSIDTKVRVGEVEAASITFNSVFHLPVPVQFGQAPTFYENVNDHEFRFYPNIKPFNDQESLEISSKLDYDFAGGAKLTAWALYSDIENDFGADGTSGAFGFFNAQQRCQDSTAALTGFPLNSPQFVGQTPVAVIFDPNGSLFGAYTPTACDGTQYQVRNQEDFSFEIRLASSSEQRLRWLGGVYYLEIEREVGVNLGADEGFGIIEQLYTTDARNPTQQLVHDSFTTDVYAVFGQLAYDVTDAIEASLALRYDHEQRRVDNLVPQNAVTNFVDTCADDPVIGGADPTPGVDPINPGLCPDAASAIPSGLADFDQVQPKLSVTWDVLDNLTAFATAGMGFKSGGFNNQGSAATVDGFINLGVVGPNDVCGDGTADCTPVNIRDQFDEETSWSYEIGAKGNWLDNRLRGELAVYHTDVDDLQFFEFFVGPFGLLRVVSNIDEVSIDGVEGSINWVTTDWLEVYAGANWLDSKIDKNSARPDTVGNESPYTPEWTASAGARLTFPMGESLALIANVDLNAVGETWFHAVQDQRRPTLFTGFGFGPGEYSVAQRDAYTLVNARVGLQGDNWSLVAFGRNVFDEDYVEEVIPAPEFGGSFIHAGSESRFGIEATLSF
jgi:iron complex outermembrane receptor protein